MSACVLCSLAELASESGAHKSCAEPEGERPTDGGPAAGGLGFRTRLPAGCDPQAVLVVLTGRAAVEDTFDGEELVATGEFSVGRLAATRSPCAICMHTLCTAVLGRLLVRVHAAKL